MRHLARRRLRYRHELTAQQEAEVRTRVLVNDEGLWAVAEDLGVPYWAVYLALFGTSWRAP